MKRLTYLMTLFMSVLYVVSCTDSSNEFVIKGTTSQERLNGYQVFLVPYALDATQPMVEDSIGVDSVYIKDGKFEFRLKKGEYLAKLTMDRKVRYGTQDLLVITEPGQVINVVIDSVSSGGGTPQNEVLQRWKEMKATHDAISGPKAVELYHLRQRGDTVAAKALSDSLAEFNRQFADEVLDVAKILGQGTAYDLLTRMYGRNE